MVDENTTTGMTILICVQSLLAVGGVVGLLAFDYFVSVAIISSLMFAKLIKLEMDEIHIDLQEIDTKWRVNGRLRNILQMHQEMFQ